MKIEDKKYKPLLWLKVYWVMVQEKPIGNLREKTQIDFHHICGLNLVLSNMMWTNVSFFEKLFWNIYSGVNKLPILLNLNMMWKAGSAVNAVGNDCNYLLIMVFHF